MRLLLLSLSACASGAFRAPWSGGARPIAPVVLPSSPQLLRFVDPKTQGEVVLVGTMHYNPSSIALAADTVRAAAEAQELRAVLVESCPTRWNATLAMQPQGSHKPIHHSHSHSHVRHSPYLSHTCRILVAYLSHTCSQAPSSAPSATTRCKRRLRSPKPTAARWSLGTRRSRRPSCG